MGDAMCDKRLLKADPDVGLAQTKKKKFYKHSCGITAVTKDLLRTEIWFPPPALKENSSEDLKGKYINRQKRRLG